MAQSNPAGLVVARLFLSAIFLYDCVIKLMSWSDTVDFMTGRGLPVAPVLLAAVIVIEIAGGLSILTGFKAQTGAAALFVMLIPITLLFHGFWAAAPGERGFQAVEFLKNLSIMGGLLLVVLGAKSEQTQ
jgi:putative oxidoreductase